MSFFGLVMFALVALVAPLAGQERLQTDWGTFEFQRDHGRTTGTVAGSADSVYRFVRRYLASAGVEIKVEDATSREVGATRLRLSRRLGSRRLSTYFSCGDGMTGPNADTWLVYLSYGIRVSPAAGGRAALEMVFLADAVDVPGGRSDRVPCTTTGNFEYQLTGRLREAFPDT